MLFLWAAELGVRMLLQGHSRVSRVAGRGAVSQPPLHPPTLQADGGFTGAGR